MCGVGITFVEDNQGALYVKSLVPGGSSARSGNVQVLHERQKPASQHAVSSITWSLVPLHCCQEETHAGWFTHFL